MLVSATLLTLLACTSTEDDSSKGRGGGNSGPGEAELVIDNPTAGAEFDAGQAIPLDVSATKDGRDLTPQDVSWRIGAWTGEGAHTSAPGLDVGDHVVQVSATVDGETLEGSVAISVLPTELNYSGTISAVATLSTDFGDFDATCDGPLTYVATRRTGSLSGGGNVTCSSDFGSESFTVGLTGTAADGTVSGSLDLEGNATPFNGTGSFGESMTATFDGTFSNSDGSLRFQGGWSASPQ